MVMVVAWPLPGVPVAMVVTQPMPGVRGIHLHHFPRHLVRPLLPDHQGPVVSSVRPGVVVQAGRPLLLLRGLLGRPVLLVVEGYTG